LADYKTNPQAYIIFDPIMAPLSLCCQVLGVNFTETLSVPNCP